MMQPPPFGPQLLTNSWKELLERVPGPPESIPPDDTWVTTPVVLPVGVLSDAAASEIYRVVSDASDHPRTQIYATPSKGQELWISRPSGVLAPTDTEAGFTFQRVPQIVAINGPRFTAKPLNTLAEYFPDGNPSAAEAFFARAPFQVDVAGEVSCRIYYYPYFRAHSGRDGLLGYGITNTIFWAVKTYRAFSSDDFPYIPNVICEWIAPAFVGDIQWRSVDELIVLDFKLFFTNLPTFYHHTETVVHKGAPAPIIPEAPNRIPIIQTIEFKLEDLDGLTIELPEAGGTGTGWTYSIVSPDGSAVTIPNGEFPYFSWDPATRTLTGNDIGGTYGAIAARLGHHQFRYRATSGTTIVERNLHFIARSE